MQPRATGSSSGTVVLVADQPHRVHGASQDATQDVAAAFVAGGGAVGEQHQRSADMVGDYPQPDIRSVVGVVARPGQWSHATCLSMYQRQPPVKCPAQQFTSVAPCLQRHPTCRSGGRTSSICRRACAALPSSHR